ncbi:MAG: DUF853 domain-containing protein, partial [Actinobacteria bacterium]|nr:DUF853 domain-containing protein [Actinomycetota bacterium]
MSTPESSDASVTAASAELARLRAEAEAAEAQLKLAQARAALAAAEAAAANAAAGTSEPIEPAPAPPAPAPPAPAPAAAAPEPAPPAAAPKNGGPLDEAQVQAVVAGYTFEGTTLDLGALMNGDPVASAQIRIPLGMMNRHGLVAGATGTGKTRTLQGLAEQLAAQGVPVFAADIKGDLSGVATPGASTEKLLARTSAIGQDWK